MAAAAGDAAEASIAQADPFGDAAAAPPRAFRLLLAYDGARFHGWQVQPGLSTVQGELERAIRAVTGESVRVDGAGRTDAGVHALAQVASFQSATRIAPERMKPALNAHLPPDVRVLRCAEAPPGFHARFQAHWRRYRYLLACEQTPFLRARAWTPRGWPEIAPMQESLPTILGEHDFRGLTTQPEGPFGCCVHEARWDRWEAGYVLVLRSNRFLYQMVRIVVGTCVEIGRGRRGSAALAEILAGGDRRAAGPLAPAHGLYLDGVGYDPPWPEDAPLLPPLPPLADR